MKCPLTVTLMTVLVVGTSCNSEHINPNAPNSGNPTQDIKAVWSPYLMVHTPGGLENTYREVANGMMKNGNLKGVRIEIEKNSLRNSYAKMFNSMNIEVLGLISNYYLFEPNIEQVIDNIFATYPEIKYFQIGNEVTTILPNTGPTMTIEEYMIVFKKIYNHVQIKYPGRAVLLTQSTFGSGTYGAEELEKMANLGLTKMSPNQVIIAINVYSPAAVNAYGSIIAERFGGYRIWVTETGEGDADRHIPYVQNTYPDLRNYLRAERIYWYVLWGGDEGTYSGMNLIKNPYNYPNYWKSPLLKVLMGEQ